MDSEDQGSSKKRIVYAPQSDHIPSASAVISVELDEDEEVEWQWTHLNGRSVVTGYSIVKQAVQIRKTRDAVVRKSLKI